MFDPESGTVRLATAMAESFDGASSQWVEDADVVIHLMGQHIDNQANVLRWDVVQREESPHGCVRFAVNGVEFYVDPSDEGPCRPRLWDTDTAIEAMFGHYYDPDLEPGE